jgi:hypothetical protein
MKRKLALVAGLLISIILAVLLLTQLVTVTTQVEQTPSIDLSNSSTLRWINSGICTPPCWEGITPGMPGPVAMDVLKQNQDVKNVQYHHDIDTKRGEINWVWEDGIDGGRIFYSGQTFDEGHVYAVVPYIKCCVALGDIIEILGSPDYAYTREIRFPTGTPGSKVYTYTLLWSDVGFAVKGYPESGTRITEQFQIDTIVFTEPGITGFLFYEGNSGNNLVPWHGFDDASRYLAP